MRRDLDDMILKRWVPGMGAIATMAVLLLLSLGSNQASSFLRRPGTASRQLASTQSFASASGNADRASNGQARQVQFSASQSDEAQGISYETLTLPKSIVHVVKIPATANVTITPAIAADGLEKLDVLAQKQGAIAAINGGFFDPNNQQTTSYVTMDGYVVLDPMENLGLMENPNVGIYIDRILNRSEFRRYQCNNENGQQYNEYAIAPHDQLIPFQCELIDALGAGPALWPNFRGTEEAFIDPINGRDALGSNSPNARSAVGITPDGTVIFAMAAQRADVAERSGLSLFELVDVMESLGVEQALNLDGGSSSSLHFQGDTHYGRLDADNNVIKRSVKSVLLVIPE